MRRGEGFAGGSEDGEAGPVEATEDERLWASLSAGDDAGRDETSLARADGAPGRAALAGVWLSLALALALGLFLPAPVAAWMRATAEALP